MTLSTAATLISYGSNAAMIAVVTAMTARKLFSQFPMFGTFALFEAVSNCVELWFFHHTPVDVYYYVYWSSQLIEAVLILFCIQELFRIVLAPYSGLKVVAQGLFWTGSGVFIPISLWMLLVTPPSHLARISTQLISAQRSFCFLELGLILILLIFCRIFALHWKPYALGITVGFGVTACATALLASFRVQNPKEYFYIYYLGAPLSFAAGTMVWSICVARKQRVTRSIDLPTSAQLAKWNIALGELLAR